MIDHGALTDLVLEHLVARMTANPDVTTGHVPPVGDGKAPEEGGWLNGQPGSGLYVPYAVLVSGGGAPSMTPLTTSEPAWRVGFSLRSHGGSRSQCDWQATIAREAIGGLKQQRFGDPAMNRSMKIINIEWAAIGPVARNDATSPPTWSVIDTVTLVCDA